MVSNKPRGAMFRPRLLQEKYHIKHHSTTKCLDRGNKDPISSRVEQQFNALVIKSTCPLKIQPPQFSHRPIIISTKHTIPQNNLQLFALKLTNYEENFIIKSEIIES